MNRPPKNFEGFVASHFREKANVNLKSRELIYKQTEVKAGLVKLLRRKACISFLPNTSLAK
ncbi:hypothetical protein SADUNF_Sadunf08G0083900 [Salix dunnii]|uniref:Uncharacterized protein n=1 Tax=Salix dunnii TaxID=1413687 RepID=A0A835JZA7_9ROSI|nr:hypothetical protein SADUNF_Sadunf08G0083900 [Salix dunnii]